MAIDHIEIPESSTLYMCDPFTEKKILRMLEQAFSSRDWIGINALPQGCTTDGQAFMIKEHNDSLWHVSEMHRGRHEFLGVFSCLPDAAEFFFVVAGGGSVPPRFE